jgi:hypothetical protein
MMIESEMLLGFTDRRALRMRRLASGGQPFKVHRRLPKAFEAGIQLLAESNHGTSSFPQDSGGLFILSRTGPSWSSLRRWPMMSRNRYSKSCSGTIRQSQR